jgi:crotonobetainyl-CoA:carnitine CoA-transferase CaiB-like acyl-CoA transferase
MSSVTHPLGNIRVLNLGGIWAGRVASMLLADQGAEVIEINRPGRIAGIEEAHLGRGKRSLSIDLKSEAGQREARSLANGAHIIIDNLGFDRARRFGLDYETIAASNPQIVYVTMPGFAEGSRREGLASWEGSIAASMGVYTDIHALGPVLGGPPIFTALPMASAYGGVHAAIAASMTFLHRIRTGVGQRIEVPLADALMSAMAVLAMKIDGQPQRFDLPPIEKAMSEIAFPILRDLSAHLTPEHRATLQVYFGQFARPQSNNYLCADGKLLFINATDHAHHARAGLGVLGMLDVLIAEGMVIGSPWEEGGDGNNISNSIGLSPHWKQRLQRGMTERFKAKPAHEWEVALGRAGVPAAVVRTTKEWLTSAVAREGGNVAALTDPELGSTIQAGRYVSIEGAGTQSPSLRPRRNDASERTWTSAPLSYPAIADPDSSKNILSGVRVLDFSNVIAAPAAARVLAEFGADVTRIDPPAPQAGPRMTMWFGVDVNQGKRAVILDLKSAEGRRVLERMIRNTDVVIHNFLDRSVPGIGLSDEQLRAINPDIVICQVSAWGGPGGGPFKEFPSFDPVLQAATGITARYGTADAPVMHGIASCVDYITGFSAALGITQALIAKTLGHGGSYVRTSLSMGAQLVQFPFAVTTDGKDEASEPSGQRVTGYGPHYRLYKASDGWIFLACRRSDITVTAEKIGAKNATDEELTTAIGASSISQLAKRLEGIPSASVVPVTRLDALRSKCTLSSFPDDGVNVYPESVAMVESAHPSGHRTNLPLPTWYRLRSRAVNRLESARPPGADTISVLATLGLSNAEIDELASRNVVANGWQLLKHYLPR